MCVCGFNTCAYTYDYVCVCKNMHVCVCACVCMFVHVYVHRYLSVHVWIPHLTLLQLFVSSNILFSCFFFKEHLRKESDFDVPSSLLTYF